MTIRATTKERKQVLEDAKWWRDWGIIFGWRLYAFSYRDTATFFLASGHLLEVPAEMRADIDRASTSLS